MMQVLDLKQFKLQTPPDLHLSHHYIIFLILIYPLKTIADEDIHLFLKVHFLLRFFGTKWRDAAV